MLTSDVDYRDGGARYRGQLAVDDAVDGKRPGVLVAHEAWGLGAHALERARMLATLGYAAFAIDMFGDRLTVTDPQEGRAIVGGLMADPQQLRRRAFAGLEVLASDSRVDSSRLGAIGFCFGGSTVLELARAGGPLKAVVSFHGTLTTIAPAQPGAVSASVLVCTGADDPMIPHEQVRAFEEEMRAANADWQVIRYGATVHSFTNPESDGSLSPGILYNPATDRRSWSAMRNHFAEAFQ